MTEYVNLSYLDVAAIIADAFGNNRMKEDVKDYPAKACYDLYHHILKGFDWNYSCSSSKAFYDLLRLYRGLHKFRSTRVEWVSTNGSTLAETKVEVSPHLENYNLVSAMCESNMYGECENDANQPEPSMVPYEGVVFDRQLKSIVFPKQKSEGIKYIVYLCENRRFPAITLRQFDIFLHELSEYLDILKKREVSIAKSDSQRVKDRKQEHRKNAKVQAARDVSGSFSSYVDYQEYINSPEWKATSRRRMRMDGFQCAICGTAKNLAVHHITYERLGREEMDDLITLCKNCHSKVHENDINNKK